jgi:hypothetical protein
MEQLDFNILFRCTASDCGVHSANGTYAALLEVVVEQPDEISYASYGPLKGILGEVLEPSSPAR